MKTFFLHVAGRFGRRSLVMLSMLLAWGFGRPTSAKEPFQPAGVERISDFSYLVWASNPAAKFGSVCLVSEDGRTLYQQYSHDISFGRKLNVADLPDGKYGIVVRIGKDLHRFDLTLQSTSKRWSEVKAVTTPTDPALASLEARH